MFLRSCLRSIPYDRRLSAFTFAATNQIYFGISLSQLLSLDFEGHLTLKMNLDYQWTEPRLRWLLDPPHAAPMWKWPTYTLIHNSEARVFSALNFYINIYRLFDFVQLIYWTRTKLELCASTLYFVPTRTYSYINT